MKYILSVILSVFAVSVFADDNLTLYYEANGQCSGLYATPPTDGCVGTVVPSVDEPTGYDGNFVGFYLDGVQLIDENGNVRADAADILAGKGRSDIVQTAFAEFYNGDDNGPWSIYFYGGDDPSVPLMTHEYRRRSDFTVGNATYIGLLTNQKGISNGLVHGWCPNPDPSTWNENTCVTNAGSSCRSGCEGRLTIVLPYDAVGPRTYYAWLDCDRGYHQDGYACVKDVASQVEQISEKECLVTNGVWDGTYCKYRVYWVGGRCLEYQDDYYIAGRENVVRCGSHYYYMDSGTKFMGWCVDPTLNSGCSNDIYGTVVIPANARGNLSLYAKLSCAIGFAYNANTRKCEKVGEFGGDWTPVYECTASQLWGCNTEAQCSGRGGQWEGNNNMCASQSFVNINGGSVWPTHNCHADHTCVGDEWSDQEECQSLGGTWSNGYCTYGITWVYNIGEAGNKPSCPTSYIAGQQMSIDCFPTRAYSFFMGWCMDDTLHASCSHDEEGHVVIPENARGHLTFYANWQCRPGTTGGYNSFNKCLTGTSDSACIRYSMTAPNLPEECKRVYNYKCTGYDLSGCLTASDCIAAGGVWDGGVNGMCGWAAPLHKASAPVTWEFYCSTNSYSAGQQPVLTMTIDANAMDNLITLPDFSQYCTPGGEKPNFVGWFTSGVTSLKNTDNTEPGVSSSIWTGVTYDSGSVVEYPSILGNLRFSGQWRSGTNGFCPEGQVKYQKYLVDYMSPTGPSRHGNYSGCPADGCGSVSHDFSNCVMTWEPRYHREFVEWCKDVNWSNCGMSADFNTTFYAKYTCSAGYVLNEDKDCQCALETKPINYVVDDDAFFPFSAATPHSPVACWRSQCGNEEVPSSWCYASYQTKHHKRFTGWCRDAARTDCPTGTFLLYGNNTYYGNWECVDGYVKSGNTCVPLAE